MLTTQKQLRILVIDDNAEQAKSLSLVLETGGYNSHVCIHAWESVALAERLRPDVILLDLAMPGKSGYDIAEEIKQHPVLQQVRLVAITGHGIRLDRLQTWTTAFDYHLMKPINFGHLETILKAVQAQEE